LAPSPILPHTFLSSSQHHASGSKVDENLARNPRPHDIALAQIRLPSKVMQHSPDRDPERPSHQEDRVFRYGLVEPRPSVLRILDPAPCHLHNGSLTKTRIPRDNRPRLPTRDAINQAQAFQKVGLDLIDFLFEPCKCLYRLNSYSIG
jgi:hypothetical protein